MEFCRDNRRFVVGINPQDSFRELARQWNALQPQEKAPFEARAAVDKARYNQEMRVYRVQLRRQRSFYYF